MKFDSPYSCSGLFARTFPPPTFLTMPAFGIDISDYAIKYTELRRRGTSLQLASYGKLDLPLEVIERGEVTDADTLVKLLTRLREQNDIKYAHVSLPEEHAYLFQLSLPVGHRTETEQMLEFHLKENVPIGADEAVFDYNIQQEVGGKQELNVSVYPAAIASQYVSAFEEAGITPLSIEIEGQATARALLEKSTVAPTLIVDIGRNDASLSISTNGNVTFTASLETGGDDLTRAISRTLDISFQEAEKLKRQHGYTDTMEGELVYNALLPVVAEFTSTIRKHLMYWQIHMGNSTEEYGDITRVVLAGGNANIRGLAEFLEATLEVPVEVGSVWRNIMSPEEQVPKISATESLEYVTSVGLALRSLLRTC